MINKLDDTKDESVDRRIADVQMGVMIERIKNLEHLINGLNEKFDKWTNGFTEKCERKHYNIDQLLNLISDKPSKKEFTTLQTKVNTHGVYWNLLIWIPTGSGIIIGIFLWIINHFKFN